MKKKDSDLYQNGSVSFNDKQSGQFIYSDFFSRYLIRRSIRRLYRFMWNIPFSQFLFIGIWDRRLCIVEIRSYP